MNDPGLYSRDEQIKDTSAQRSHLVILGAGASVAACLHGDANGRHLPVMMNFVDTLELGAVLDNAGIVHEGRNFEDIYSEIADDPAQTAATKIVEDTVRDYFAGMELPDEPTIYDYLVLSLRPKDAIATFNWDPFLWQALERNHAHTNLPQFFFLHGSSVIGWCDKDKKQGMNGRPCQVCGKTFIPTRMLYPVANKDYVTDGYIASQWKSVKNFLGDAFLFTVFGYGAPTSDTAAVDMMSNAWGTPQTRVMEEIEIIDIEDEELIAQRWDKFTHTHHYTVIDDYFNSSLGQHPRRSVEAYWQSIIEARFREENPAPRDCSLQELWDWHSELLQHE